METKRTALAETIIVTIVALLSLVILWSFMSTREVPAAIPVTCTIALGVLGIAVMNWSTDPDRLRARQSDRSLYLANKTLGFMREGLSEESAGAVCELLLPYTNAVAIAITDRERILGFAGVQDGIHEVGERMESLATKLTLEEKTMRVVLSPDEIGLPGKKQAYGAAIVVPLVVRNQAIGTLKFYYRTPRRINETQQSMAEGLGELLSTQLSLAELDAQTELATRMELKALQAQINPHFLFNSLNAGSQLATMEGADRTEHFLSRMAQFFRYNVKKTGGDAALSEEIDSVDNYIYILNVRFAGDIHYVKQIDPSIDLETTRMPSLILQPLVENAIQHGIHDDHENGNITITVDYVEEKENETGTDCVRITVSDNGTGMTRKQLDRIMEPGEGRAGENAEDGKDSAGIAITNVISRLELYYNRDHLFSIWSDGPGTGTEVTILLPGNPDQTERD